VGLTARDQRRETLTHTENVAYIGDINGTLADKIRLTFVNRVPYNGSFANIPIFIAAQSIPSLSPTQQEGIRNTFSNFQPIVLVHCSEAEINTLLGILGLEQNYTFLFDFIYQGIGIVKRV
jgi:hypothetical protein